MEKDFHNQLLAFQQQWGNWHAFCAVFWGNASHILQSNLSLHPGLEPHQTDQLLLGSAICNLYRGAFQLVKIHKDYSNPIALFLLSHFQVPGTLC